MIAWMKRKIRDYNEGQKRTFERLDAERAYWERARRGIEYEFTPQADITALEIALILRDFRPSTRRVTMLGRVRMLEGCEIDPAYARHFCPLFLHNPEV